MNKFQEWVTKHKPQPVRVQKQPYMSKEEILEAKESELKQAWDEFKVHFRIPIYIFTVVTILLAGVFVLWALAVVDIQRSCFQDTQCRKSIERANVYR